MSDLNVKLCSEAFILICSYSFYKMMSGINTKNVESWNNKIYRILEYIDFIFQIHGTYYNTFTYSIVICWQFSQ